MKDPNDTQTHDTALNSADARWSRFREAAKGLADPDQWDALDAVWAATKVPVLQGSISPVKDPPRVVWWTELQLGDLALDVDYLGVSTFAHVNKDGWVWRASTGTIGRVCGSWHHANAPRAILFARNVPDSVEAVRLACADLNITPELQAEARRPLDGAPHM